MNSNEFDLYHNTVSIDSLVTVKSVRTFLGDYNAGYQAFNTSLMSRNGTLKALIRNSSFAAGNIGKNQHLGQESYLSSTEIIGPKMRRPKRLDISGIKKRTAYEYHGLEDPRYFLWNDKEYALCVQPDTNIQGSQVVLLDLQDLTISNLPDGLGRKWNKNWMPYVSANNELFVISDVFPTIVYQIIDDQWIMVHRTHGPSTDFVIHGSSNIFDYKGNKTAMVHGRIAIPSGAHWGDSRVYWMYWHAFVTWLDDDWEKIRMGRPFYFENKQIEFCTSVVEHEEKFLITYSVNDWGFNILEIEYDELEKLL